MKILLNGDMDVYQLDCDVQTYQFTEKGFFCLKTKEAVYLFGIKKRTYLLKFLPTVTTCIFLIEDKNMM